MYILSSPATLTGAGEKKTGPSRFRPLFLTELTKLSKFRINKRADSLFTQIIHLVYTNQTLSEQAVYTWFTASLHSEFRAKKCVFTAASEALLSITTRDRQSDHSFLLLVLWRSSSVNREKCLQGHVRLRQRIYSSNRPFRPILPDSNRPLCGKTGFVVQRFGGMTSAQSLRKQEAWPIKTRYMCYFELPIAGRSLK